MEISLIEALLWVLGTLAAGGLLLTAVAVLAVAVALHKLGKEE